MLLNLTICQLFIFDELIAQLLPIVSFKRNSGTEPLLFSYVKYLNDAID